MRRSLIIALVFSTGAFTCFGTSSEGAAQEGGASCHHIQNEEGEIVEICDIAVPGVPGSDGTSDSSLQYSPYYWKRQKYAQQDDTSWPCIRGPGIENVGTQWHVELIERATGVVVDEWNECQYPDQPPPPSPPDPPGPPAVWQNAAPLLALTPEWNPKVRGLTGLETWLWCDSPGAVTNSGALGGWTVASTSGLVGVSWELEGPEELTVAGGSGCGSDEHPSGRWMPNIMGDYEVTARGTWGGSYTATYSNAYVTVTIGPIDMGTVTVAGAPHDYEVIEHVGVLIG